MPLFIIHVHSVVAQVHFATSGDRFVVFFLVFNAGTGKFNVAFECYFLTRRLHKCLDLLIKRKMFAEGAFFARSYVPR